MCIIFSDERHGACVIINLWRIEPILKIIFKKLFFKVCSLSKRDAIAG